MFDWSRASMVWRAVRVASRTVETSPWAVRVKPCFVLKLHAGQHEAALVVIGLDAAKALGMDLVDRDMKVKMACVEMGSRQPLMSAKPYPVA